MSELMIPEVFTADYVGEPGKRTFYLQLRGEGPSFTFHVEKQQLSVLAEKMRELLVLVDQNDTIGSALPERDPALGLEPPMEPRWRVGSIGLGYEEDDDLIVMLLTPEAEDENEETDGMRFGIRRDQVRAFVLHVLALVEEGRPTCQLCGLPMDPEGHKCPASNGHRLSD